MTSKQENKLSMKVKNNDLAAKSTVSASDIIGGRDTVAADPARNVHAAATANVANLGAYGVPAAKLAALKAKIDAYAVSITKPRDAVSSGSTATKQLADEFDAADSVLGDPMDALVPQFSESNAKFVKTTTTPASSWTPAVMEERNRHRQRRRLSKNLFQR